MLLKMFLTAFRTSQQWLPSGFDCGIYINAHVPHSTAGEQSNSKSVAKDRCVPVLRDGNSHRLQILEVLLTKYEIETKMHPSFLHQVLAEQQFELGYQHWSVFTQQKQGLSQYLRAKNNALFNEA